MLALTTAALTTADGVAPAEVKETHSAVVFLLGDHAYKLKKAVDLGFVDFRAREARLLACRREVELNRRLAPDVYLGVVDVRAETGACLDHLVVMRRMPADRRLSTLVRRGIPVDDQVRQLARTMAAFHARTERTERIRAEGGQPALRRRWTANLRETDRFCGSFLTRTDHAEVERCVLRYLDGRGPLFEERVAQGLICDGHGDLTADDVFCLPDGPRVLDCLEFDDRLRWVDVLDDVAFLAMDLERLDAADVAARFVDWYVEFSGHRAVPSLAHHYVAYRAFVRAKVSCLRAEQVGAATPSEAGGYVEQALRHLRAGAVGLILVAGPPGTGKTTLATSLAGRLAAGLLRSDEVRAELHPDPEGRHTGRTDAATYAEMLRRARTALQRGLTVVADATWLDPGQRESAAAVAADTSSELFVFRCHTPLDVAAARAEQRFGAGTDVSDADGAIARRLYDRGGGWPDAVTIDTTGTPDQTLAAALDALADLVPPTPVASPRPQPAPN